MASLCGQVVCLTGAASGIGYITARLLAAHGVLLSLGDLNEKGLAETAQELISLYPGGGGEKMRNETTRAGKSPIFTFRLDVCSMQSCRDWIGQTQAHFDARPIAGAANLAGVFGASITKPEGRLRNVGDEEWDFVMDVNCKGVFNCLRAELPAMKTGKDGRAGGSIVNAASIAGLVGIACNGPYVASKHAVIGMTKTAAKEEGEYAIRVNAIAPGLIDTPMLAGIEEANGSSNLFGDQKPGALARYGDAEEVGRLILFLLGDDSSFITGSVMSVDGGWNC